MGRLLWKPSEERIERANMTRFTEFVNRKRGLDVRTYPELYDWSVGDIPGFWADVWEFMEVVHSRPYDEVVDDLGRFPGAKWFSGARLNFAENLLRFADDRPAFIFRGEDRRSSSLSYSGLRERVARLAGALRGLVKPGDRVCCYMPNLVETAVAMLATASLGALWASCGSELGPKAVVERLGQVGPKVMFTADGYFYKGKRIDVLQNAETAAKEMPSLEKVLVTPYAADAPDIGGIPHAALWDDFVSSAPSPSGGPVFEQLPFDHPLYIMFSSGTTGMPKCMVQSAGGVLLNHLKELVLHTDLRREDRVTYITSPSWMMWHWMTSSLAVGSTLVLYDGNPNHPDWRTMWRLVQDEGVTLFGCSASYINYLRGANARPGREHDLSTLREISQTGSALSAEGFEWVYGEVKADLHLNSISGGTDINGCFAIGSPTLPVHAGELQARALGMKVKAYDEGGNAVFDRQAELVCEAPFPSMPLCFWNDPEGARYRATYFEHYWSTGKNVWRHGDYIVLNRGTGGMTFYGRSDAVLKPSGVRIGTAEIYNVVERMPEVADSLAVGQEWKGDQRVVLFVKLAPGHALTDALRDRIRNALRGEASPRHVPALILEAPDIPYTFNMKKVELAVANIINGRPVTNREALVNPASLEFFEKVVLE